MTEFSAGVRILLERMKSNPEDFDLLEHNVATMTEIRGKFYYFGKNMEQMIAGPNKKGVLENWSSWHYFTEEEQAALIAGFKEMKRTKFDKETMERVFDETYVQRQRDFHNRTTIQPLQPKQNPQQYQTLLTNATNNISNGGIATGNGLMNAIGLGSIFGGSK